MSEEVALGPDGPRDLDSEADGVVEGSAKSVDAT